MVEKTKRIGQQELLRQSLTKEFGGLTIPQRFIDLNNFPEGATYPHRLTKLPMETEAVWKILAERLTCCVKKDRGWACLHADFDQLNTLNNLGKTLGIGRELGDLAIRWNAAVVLRGIEKISFASEVEIIAVTGHGADEIVVWFFGPSPEELTALEKLVDSQDFAQLVQVEDPDFVLSNSIGLITSKTETIRQALVEAKKWIAVNPTEIATNLYREVYNTADAAALQEKIVKDLARLPLEVLLELPDIKRLISLVKRNIGGSRVSAPLLELLLKLVSVETSRDLLTRLSEPVRLLALKELRTSEEELSSIARTPDELNEMFQALFGSEE